MRVLLTGSQSPTGRAVARELLRSGHVIREFGGSITDRDAVRRQVKHVDLVVHADWLDAGSSFEAHVDHNLCGSIKLAQAAEATEIPLQYAIDFEPNRTIAMAIQVLRDEYGVGPWW